MSGVDEEFEREEKAFRDAFAGQLEGRPFRPIDPGSITASVRDATRPWGRVLAAAAVVVAVVLGAGVVLPRIFATTAAMPSAATVAGVPEAAGGAAPVDDKAAASAGPQAAPGPYSSAVGDARAADGYRWESYRDVRVQVPASWGYAFAPASDHCSLKDFPTRPYVDLARGGEGVRAILCTRPLADDRQAMHLSFRPAGSEPLENLGSDAWRQYSRTLGAAMLTVTARVADEELATRILDSAEVVPDGVDPNGCPTSLPSVSPSALSGLEADTISVCLYEAEADRGAFRSSVLLTGAPAAKAWRAVLAAPGGGGPDADASTCGDGRGWPVVLYVGSARVPVAASLAGCAGNGVADAAAMNGLRVLTTGLCRALLVDPVRISTGFGPAASVCLR